MVHALTPWCSLNNASYLGERTWRKKERSDADLVERRYRHALRIPLSPLSNMSLQAQRCIFDP
jgi:hypothetical protein